MRSKIECCLATWVSCVEMLEWLLVTEGQSETGVGLTGEHAHCLISLLSRTWLSKLWPSLCVVGETETAQVRARDDRTDGDTRTEIIAHHSLYPSHTLEYLSLLYSNSRIKNTYPNFYVSKILLFSSIYHLNKSKFKFNNISNHYQILVWKVMDIWFPSRSSASREVKIKINCSPKLCNSPQLIKSLLVLPLRISSSCQDLSFITSVTHIVLANFTFIIYDKTKKEKCSILNLF